jgi:hypothetical protein
LAVWRDSIEWIQIENVSGGAESRVVGLCAGIFIGGLLSAGNEGTPDQQSFLRGKENNAALVLAASGVAGLIVVGGILAGARPVERRFTMNGSRGGTDPAWERLRSWVGGEFVAPDFHMTLSCGFVTERVHTAGASYPVYDNSTSAFNIVRSLAFTYSVTREIELGGSYILFGEPARSGAFWTQTMNARGVFAVGSYDMARFFLPDRVRWNCGAGIGPVWVHFNRSFYVDYYSGEIVSPLTGIREQSIDENALGATVFTRLEVYPFEGLSLGVFCEYTTALGLPKIDSIPEAGLEGGIPGNSCYGFAVGMHF